MSYKYSTGSTFQGDIYYEDDRLGERTYIDFGHDTITLRPSGSAILFAGASAVGIGTTDPDNTLHVKSTGTTHVKIESEEGSEAAVRLKSGDQSSVYLWAVGGTPDLRFYVNGADRMHLDGDGNVGIATTDPDYTLDVAGTMGVDGYIYHNGDSNTYIRFQDDDINLQAGGKSMVKMDEGNGLVTINNGDNNIDFKVMSDDGTHLIRTDAANNRVGLGTASPAISCDFHFNSMAMDNDTGGGWVVKFGSGTLTAGKLYYLHTDGAWTATDADAASTGGDQLLGIALGSAPGTDGVLLRGFFDAHTYLDTHTSGKAVYISVTAGEMTTTAPSATGDIIRIIGYCTSQSKVIYFNPSSTFVELS